MNKNQGINQKQHKPHKSPQAAIIYGDQHINYSEDKKGKVKRKYNKEKIEKRLLEIKEKLKKLKEIDHVDGNSSLSLLKKEVTGIIHRVYVDNPKDSEKRLIHKIFFVISNLTEESEYQRWYFEDVNGLIDTIEVILREMDLD